MNWMEVLKIDLTLPNKRSQWLEKLENVAGAESWAKTLDMYKDSKDKKLRINNYQDFKEQVNSWGSNSNNVVISLTPLIDKKYDSYDEQEEIKDTIEESWNKIYPTLTSFIRVRDKGRIKGATKGRKERSDTLKRLFKDAEENINAERFVDWAELAKYFKLIYPRESKNKINRFINVFLGEKTKETIFNHAPKDWPYKHYFKTKTLKDEEGQEYVKDLEDFTLTDIDINKAVEYIKKYSELKRKRKLRYNLKPMWIAELSRGLQFEGKSQRWTNKLFIELLQTDDIDTEVYMKRWLENIKRKYSIRLDKLKESYLEQSWSKKEGTNQRFTGYVDDAFEGSKEEYFRSVGRDLETSKERGGQLENWIDWRNKKIQSITDSIGKIPKTFVDWVGEINRDLDGSSSTANSKKAVKEMEEIFGEEEMEEYKQTMSLKDFFGFTNRQSAPHPMNEEKTLTFFSPPATLNSEGNLNAYSDIVTKIFNEGVVEEREKYDNLLDIYDDYEIRAHELGQSIPEDIFGEQTSTKGIGGATKNFTTSTQKTLAYTIYDMILSDRTIQDTIIVETAQKYRGTDVNFLEALRLLRKIDVVFNINQFMPTVKRLQSKLSSENYDDLKQKIKDGEQILKDEIIDMEKGIDLLLVKIKPVVIDLVKKKLLTIIQNQRHYQAEVNHNIMDELVKEGFIRRQ